ncbi:hypothetical protein EDEG_03565 [Edhazardia aedis USNM 41457]|uniref:RPN1 N-terminal domain-containing protein n=1 Tax=Edhazardia aedis (strain USNM 41457) TaxID=1003232 RepID=J9DHA6_EDHAE|nr:hypothetical protein EDEG_03565 [Edhazardia aedis USNM 41457]|eukprot:EJW01985.1 hypothetical protein EDEG_03565 [Edhazardia aedis USNM 41457]
MLSWIINNLKSCDVELRKTAFIYLLNTDYQTFFDLEEKLIEIYLMKYQLTDFEMITLRDILDVFRRYKDPKNEIYGRNDVFNSIRDCIYWKFFIKSTVEWIFLNQKGKKLLFSAASKKIDIYSFIFTISRDILSLYQFELDKPNPIKKLGIEILIPLMEKQRDKDLWFVQDTEISGEEPHIYDVILNLCLIQTKFVDFIKYFLRYGRTMPLYDEIGNRISYEIIDKKNLMLDFKNTKDSQNEEKNNLCLNLSSIVGFMGFQEFFGSTIDDFVDWNLIEYKSINDIVSLDSKIYFETITSTYDHPSVTRICEYYMSVVDKLSKQKFKLFNYRNIRFSIILDYAFRNCTYGEFLQLIFIVNKAKVMMFNDDYIKKMLQYRKSLGSKENCLMCCKKGATRIFYDSCEVDANQTNLTDKVDKKRHSDENESEKKKLYSNLCEQIDTNTKVCYSCHNEYSLEEIENLWSYEVVKKILNDRFFPAIKQILHEHLNITDPIDICLYYNEANIPNDAIKASDISLLSLINGLLHFGYVFDDFFTSNRLSFDIESNFLDDNKAFIMIFGCFGMIRNNSFAKLSISDLLEKQETCENTNSNIKKNQKRKNKSYMEYLKIKGIKFQAKNAELLKIEKIDNYFRNLIKEKKFSNKKMGLILALAICQNIYGDSHDFYNQQTILCERIGTNTKNFSEFDEENLQIKYADVSDIYGCENYGGKDSKLLCDYILQNLPLCTLYQEIASMMALHMLYCDTKIKNSDLYEKIIEYTSHKNIATSAWAIFALGSIYNGNFCNKFDNRIHIWFNNWYQNDPTNPFFPIGILGISLLFLGRNDLCQNNMKIYFPKEIDFFCQAMGFAGKGDKEMRKKLSEIYKEINENNNRKYKIHNTEAQNKFDSTQHNKNINKYKKTNECESSETISEDIYKNYMLCFCLLSITLLGLGDHRSKLDSKDQLIKISKIDKTNFIPLCLALLYASTPVDCIIDAVIDSFSNCNDHLNAILALGIIGAGTKNTKITEFLQKYQTTSLDIKEKKLIKISLSLCNLGKGTLSLSPNIVAGSIINKKSLISLLCIACLFMNNISKPLLEDFDFLFLLIASVVQNKYAAVFDTNMKLKFEEILIKEVHDDFHLINRDDKHDRSREYVTKNGETIVCVNMTEYACDCLHREFSVIDINISNVLDAWF